MAAMTFLQLCNSLIEKCGINGGGLAAVTGQTGESLRVVNWINEAYLNIQELQDDWLWMQGDVSFATISHQSSYTPLQCGVTDFARWDMDSFRCYLTSAGTTQERFLTPMPYRAWRDEYLFGPQRTNYSQPEWITVTPDKSLGLGMIPDAQGYTVVGKYFKTPEALVDATDVPLLPERFHMLIVYEAMRSYATYEAAPEVMAEASRQYKRMYSRLENDQLPEFELGGPLE